MTTTSQRFEAYGVPFEVLSDGPLSDELLQFALPPGSKRSDRTPDLTVTVTTDDGWHIAVPGEATRTFRDEAALAEGLETCLAEHIALTSPDGVFIHAGVVGTPSGAILIPGRSFTGKSTLVEACLRAGLVYFTDEYAVLDADGMVHPYPRRLALRVGSERHRPTASELGADTATAPSPVALILQVPYRADTPTTLQPLAPERAALHLIDNAIAARSRPAEVLATCARTARTARALVGTHQGATALVAELTRRLE